MGVKWGEKDWGCDQTCVRGSNRGEKDREVEFTINACSTKVNEVI